MYTQYICILGRKYSDTLLISKEGGHYTIVEGSGYNDGIKGFWLLLKVSKGRESPTYSIRRFLPHSY